MKPRLQGAQQGGMPTAHWAIQAWGEQIYRAV